MDLIANNKSLFSLLTVQENSRKCRGSTIFASILTTFLSRGDVVCYVDIERTLSRIDGQVDDGGSHFVFSTPKFRSFIHECRSRGKLIVLDGKDIIGFESEDKILNSLPTKEFNIGKLNMSAIFEDAPLVHKFFPSLILQLKRCKTQDSKHSAPDQEPGHVEPKIEDELETALGQFDAIFINGFELLLIEDLNASLSFLRKILKHKKKRSVVLLVDSCMLDTFVLSQLDQLSDAILFPRDTTFNVGNKQIDASSTLYYKRQGKKAGKVDQSFKIELEGPNTNPLHIIYIKQTDKNKMAAAKVKPEIATSFDPSAAGDDAKLARLQARVPFSLRATREEVEGRHQNLILPHKAKVMREEECVAEYFPSSPLHIGVPGLNEFLEEQHDDEYEEMDPDDDLDV